MIIFLTDGAPTVGETSPREIQRNVINNNNNDNGNGNEKVPIYGLAFGRDADYNLIRNISLSSNAYARRIFEGSDAALQLEDFYLQLANPLLNDVKFNYVGDSKQVNHCRATVREHPCHPLLQCFILIFTNENRNKRRSQFHKMFSTRFFFWDVQVLVEACF